MQKPQLGSDGKDEGHGNLRRVRRPYIPYRDWILLQVKTLTSCAL
jgi:hypothetical protein